MYLKVSSFSSFFQIFGFTFFEFNIVLIIILNFLLNSALFIAFLNSPISGLNLCVLLH